MPSIHPQITQITQIPPSEFFSNLEHRTSHLEQSLTVTPVLPVSVSPDASRLTPHETRAGTLAPSHLQGGHLASLVTAPRATRVSESLPIFPGHARGRGVLLLPDPATLSRSPMGAHPGSEIHNHRSPITTVHPVEWRYRSCSRLHFGSGRERSGLLYDSLMRMA
jgi:hypothetical protein